MTDAPVFIAPGAAPPAGYAPAYVQQAPAQQLIGTAPHPVYPSASVVEPVPAQQPAAPAPVLATVEAEVKRDRFGRPHILPDPAAVAAAQAEGREVPKAKYYTRASTLGDCLEDTYNLERWKQRMVLLGCLEQPDLLMRAAAYRADKDKLNETVEAAMTAAKAGARAELGTALHKVTETIDLGRDPGVIPEPFVADLAAYRQVTAGWQYLAAETFVVCDELETAGTFDRLRLVPPKPRSKAKPKARIVDLKTGSSVEFSWLKFAVQLAVYARGHRYDPATGARIPLGLLPSGEVVEVDTRVAEVVWLPAGEGRAEVFEVDVASGFTAAGLAVGVRRLRREAKGWATAAGKGEASLEDLIVSAPSIEALQALWSERAAEFTPEVQQVASARWAVLTAGAA